ncbi:MAG: YggT family protein [Holosporales bacterium]|nr:YggT family protein [Holosporales bacterium]
MNFFEYVLIGYIILGWFLFFGAIKNRDGIFFKIYVFLASKIEPIFLIIRKFIPPIAGFDFSPLVIFLCLHFAKAIIFKLFFALAYG